MNVMDAPKNVTNRKKTEMTIISSQELSIKAA